jgi:hypothetical protein
MAETKTPREESEAVTSTRTKDAGKKAVATKEGTAQLRTDRAALLRGSTDPDAIDRVALADMTAPNTEAVSENYVPMSHAEKHALGEEQAEVYQAVMDARPDDDPLVIAKAEAARIAESREEDAERLAKEKAENKDKEEKALAKAKADDK